MSSSETTSGSAPSSTTGRVTGYVLLAMLGAVSPFLPKLALFALVGTLLGFLSLPQRYPRWWLGLVFVSGAGALIGFVRFLVTEALPGIVQGGTIATEASAVSNLRTILFAEGSLRRSAAIDPDGDGVGSAALLGELLGSVGLRGGRRLYPPLLERFPEPVETRLGPAVELGGFFFSVCLPALGGGWTARPGEAIDDEAAEARFVVYAWPSSEGRGLVNAYFIDQHDKILFARSGAPQGRRSRIGRDRPPSCDDAFAPASREEWQTWRGKQARSNLPGDRR